MSPPDFPTYGRGDDPTEPDDADRYARPAPYGPGGYRQPPTDDRQPPARPPAQPPAQDPAQPLAQDPAHGQPGPYVEPGPYGEPGSYGQPGPYGGAAPYGPSEHYGQPGPHGQFGQFGQPEQYGYPGQYEQPGPYGPPSAYGGMYGAGGHPQQSGYGEPPTPAVPRDPRAARLLLIAAIVTGFYGLLVLTVQRVALREIVQAPGSPLNHPLRTDVIDTVGQLAVLGLGGAALTMWLRDVLARRRAGRQPDPIELGGLVLVGVSVVPLLIWVAVVLSTGMGATNEAVDRLPTAYAWGGTGLLLLAVAFTTGYRALRPEVSNPVVQAAPTRPPWE